MLYPSINLLRTKVDSKYTLVTMAAKRARDLIDEKPPLIKVKIDKPVSIATEEIAEDLVTYTRNFSTEEEAKELEEASMRAEEAAAALSAAGITDVAAEITEETEDSEAEAQAGEEIPEE